MSYATTPTLSVDAPHESVSPLDVTLEQEGWPGVVGIWVSEAVPTVSRSRLGPPSAVVEVARTVLVPARNAALTALVCQVSQSAVGGKDIPVATSVPLTVMSIGRSTVVPLA